MIHAAVVDDPIDPQSLTARVADHGNGATALFLGTVRSTNEGRAVTGIEYSAYREMAEAEMEKILIEAKARFGVDHAAIEHRVGTLELGDVSIGVAVASPHRRAAMDALHHIVEETKKRAPVWKLEHYSDGDRAWVGSATGEAP